MEQTQIYNYLGIDEDPIFSQVTNLKKGQSVEVANMTVSLNLQGLYEVEATNFHDCFSSKKAVYDCLSRLISSMVHPVG